MAAGVLLMSWVIVVELPGVVVPWPLVCCSCHGLLWLSWPVWCCRGRWFAAHVMGYCG